jgi:hypothetical protein
MYRSGLVPRRMCWLGLIGGPLIIISGTALLFGGNNPSHAMHSLQAIVSIPEILWELSLGVYCTIWGFKRDAPILARSAPNLPGSAPNLPGSGPDLPGGATVLAGSAG